MDDDQKSYGSVRKFLVSIGVVLILVGLALLFAFSCFAYQVFTAPQDVQLVQYIMNLLNVETPVMKGKFVFATPQGPQAADFEVEISKEIKTIMFLFFSVVGFVFFVGSAKIFIESGVNLLKGAFYEGDVVKRK